MCFQTKTEKEEKCKSWLAKNLLALSLVFLSLDNDDKNYEITNKYYHDSELENLIHEHNTEQKSSCLFRKGAK